MPAIGAEPTRDGCKKIGIITGMSKILTGR
jgi:hypothetical protein